MSSELTTVVAVVRQIDGNEALVEVAEEGCGRCHESGGCGGQNLSRMLCANTRIYRVANPDGARMGERVLVGIAAGAVRRSANLAYGLPLVGLIGGGAFGSWLGGDLGSASGAAVGLAVAWIIFRTLAIRGEKPTILGRS